MKQLLFAFLVILLDAMSCGPRERKSFEVSVSAIVLENHEGANVTFKVTSNTKWYILVSGGEKWLEVSPLSGEGDAVITVKALSSNDYSSDRSRLIQVVPELPLVEKEVYVIQKGKPSADTHQ